MRTSQGCRYMSKSVQNWVFLLMTLHNITTPRKKTKTNQTNKKKKSKTERKVLTNTRSNTAATSQQGSPAFNHRESYECWLQCYSTPQTVTNVGPPSVVSKWYKSFLPPGPEGMVQHRGCLQDATWHFVLSSTRKTSL